jgi:polysaccharide deacetylase 2 family uncharacterized protein YibQ
MARKRRRLPVPVWVVASAMLLLTGALAVWVWGPTRRSGEPVVAPKAEPEWRAKPGDVVAFADTVGSRVKLLLTGLGVPVEEVAVRRLPENRGSAMRWEVVSDVPSDLPLAVCNLAVTRLSRRLGGDVLEATQNREGHRLSMLLGLDGVRTNLVTLRMNSDLSRTPGRIAIVVDDVGYQARDLIQGFCDLKQRVTLSIFPSEEHTAWSAARAHEAGHGVMIHLPMEPLDYPRRDPGPDAIFSDYADERIRALTREALSAVPHARGMNNHMGSRVTEDRRAVGAVLREASVYGFFFVDSMTSPRSVAFDLAQEMGMACGRNLLYLDTVETVEGVERALERLAAEARRRGTAIGIGHAKPVTLEVLRRELPKLEQAGIRFVAAAEAVR